MPFLFHKTRAKLLVTAALALTPSGCFVPGRACGTEPSCKFVDLLAVCATGTAGCVRSGTVQVSPSPNTGADPAAVETGDFETLVGLKPGSSVTVPVVGDAVALPLLQISLFVNSPPEAGQVGVLLDGTPWTCVPQVSDASVEWRCPLPAGTQTIELQVGAGSIIDASIKLTEPTCTGTTMVCGE
jgi:hypothetical protein